MRIENISNNQDDRLKEIDFYDKSIKELIQYICRPPHNPVNQLRSRLHDVRNNEECNNIEFPQKLKKLDGSDDKTVNVPLVRKHTEKS